MRCNDIRQILSVYLDGRLSGSSASDVETHLAQCKDCALELSMLREAKTVLRSKEKIPAPADMDFSFFRKLRSVTDARQQSKPYSTYKIGRLAVAVASVVLLFTISYYTSASLPVVSNFSGMVKIYRAGSNEWSVMDRKMRLAKNDIVKTFSNSRVDITMPGVSTVRLKSNTELKMAELGSRMQRSDIIYSIDKGKVLIDHNGNQQHRNRFIIETPEALNTALGTGFVVNVMPESSRTWVGVLTGAVRVKSLVGTSDGVVVNSGQQTEVYRGSSPLSPTALTDREWDEVQELYQLGGSPQVALLISSGENRVRELLRPCRIYIKYQKSGQIPFLIKQAADAFNKAIKENNRDMHLEAIRKFEEIVSDFPDNRHDVQLLLYIGAYYYYLGMYDDAIDSFDKVVNGYPASNLASLAQCAIGLIYEEKVQDKSKAIEAYQKILADYPQSPEAVQAREGLSRLSA